MLGVEAYRLKFTERMKRGEFLARMQPVDRSLGSFSHLIGHSAEYQCRLLRLREVGTRPRSVHWHEKFNIQQVC